MSCNIVGIVVLPAQIWLWSSNWVGFSSSFMIHHSYWLCFIPLKSNTKYMCLFASTPVCHVSVWASVSAQIERDLGALFILAVLHSSKVLCQCVCLCVICLCVFMSVCHVSVWTLNICVCSNWEGFRSSLMIRYSSTVPSCYTSATCKTRPSNH